MSTRPTTTVKPGAAAWAHQDVGVALAAAAVDEGIVSTLAMVHRLADLPWPAGHPRRRSHVAEDAQLATGASELKRGLSIEGISSLQYASN